MNELKKESQKEKKGKDIVFTITRKRGFSTSRGPQYSLNQSQHANNLLSNNKILFRLLGGLKRLLSQDNLCRLFRRTHQDNNKTPLSCTQSQMENKNTPNILLNYDALVADTCFSRQLRHRALLKL